ncbi:hypothetical protein [Mesorhizobium caraganae]|uniref:hypothetical protein n=1 Tax=Mesorhizobium caraganae TaxID=483206 RepID=UPI00333BE6EB
MTKNFDHQAAVREACAKNGIELDELGPATGRFSHQLEQDLLGYDIVFATARMAIEAAAVGCAVVVCDARGFAGLLNTANMQAWRRMNLGVGVLAKPTTVENLMDAISRFDAGDAAAASAYFRRVAGDAHFVEEHLRIYSQAMQTDEAPNSDARFLATASWIEEIGISHQRRRWFHIVKEHGWPDSPEPTALLMMLQSNTKILKGNAASLTKLGEQVGSIELEIAKSRQIMLGESNPRAAIAETSQTLLRAIDKEVSVLATFVTEIKRFYNRMIPLFIRKILLWARRRD